MNNKDEHVIDVEVLEPEETTEQNNKFSKEKILSFLSSVFALVKGGLIPFASTARFVKDDIGQSVKHDIKIALFISLSGVVMFVLGILLWVTLGAGLVIYLLSGTGAVFYAWLYILIFQIGTILILALLIAILKGRLKTPESVQRAEKLLRLK